MFDIEVDGSGGRAQPNDPLALSIIDCDVCDLHRTVVEATGFEPATPATPAPKHRALSKVPKGGPTSNAAANANQGPDRKQA